MLLCQPCRNHGQHGGEGSPAPAGDDSALQSETLDPPSMGDRGEAVQAAEASEPSERKQDVAKDTDGDKGCESEYKSVAATRRLRGVGVPAPLQGSD